PVHSVTLTSLPTHRPSDLPGRKPPAQQTPAARSSLLLDGGCDLHLRFGDPLAVWMLPDQPGRTLPEDNRMRPARMVCREHAGERRDAFRQAGNVQSSLVAHLSPSCWSFVLRPHVTGPL